MELFICLLNLRTPFYRLPSNTISYLSAVFQRTRGILLSPGVAISAGTTLDRDYIHNSSIRKTPGNIPQVGDNTRNICVYSNAHKVYRCNNIHKTYFGKSAFYIRIYNNVRVI